MDSWSEPSWHRLSGLVERGDLVAVAAFLDGLPRDERARAVSRMGERVQGALMRLLGPAEAADLLEQFCEAQVVEVLEDLSPGEAAAIVDELPSNEQADILSEFAREDADAILDQMAPEEAQDARRLLRYPADVAGGLMLTEFLSFPVTASVEHVLTDMREHAEEYSDYEIQYAYISGEGGKLVGVLRLRDLILARPQTGVEAIMLKAPMHLPALAPLSRLKAFFSDHHFVGVPITDEAGVLLGVVRRVAVEEAIGERETGAFLSFSGLSGEEELRTMPWRQAQPSGELPGAAGDVPVVDHCQHTGSGGRAHAAELHQLGRPAVGLGPSHARAGRIAQCPRPAAPPR